MNEVIELSERDYSELLQQAIAVLPWGRNLLLMEKGQNSKQAMIYAKVIISKGWSCEMLLHAVKGLPLDLFRRPDDPLLLHFLLCVLTN